MKICHLTSVHQRYDIRIFEKECVSLANHGFNTFLIVNDALEDECYKGVTIVSTGYSEKSRMKRLISGRKYLLEKALECDASVYHIHDPELLPLGMKLIKKGKVVIYDSHEDVPRQILSKQWIPKLMRKMISRVVEAYENYCAKRLSAVVVPTPYIEKRFKTLNNTVEQICNFPIRDEFFASSISNNKKYDICYIGNLSRSRGIEMCARATCEMGINLEIAGKFETEEFKDYILGTYKNVNYHGILNRNEVVELLNSCKLGLAILLPMPNYINAYPIKLFEYMASGIPVVTSDFPVWRDIVEKNKCGYCVNPEELSTIIEAIRKILNNPNDALQMGSNGIKAIREIYNWSVEEKKLIRLYETIVRE